MSGASLLDDLARALSEPMRRRRALRVVASSLAVAVLPGVTARRAPAAGAVRRPCGADRRVCLEFTDRQYCCRAPSWRFFCGNRPGVCVDTCQGDFALPCTARVAHPESGINGICCDGRIHSGCVRVGAPPERRPDGEVVSELWKPSCCPKEFGFCGGVCCEPPNRCVRGSCRCPDGAASLDGRRCCPPGRRRSECFSVGTRPIAHDPEQDGTLVGVECCPNSRPHCCGTQCCKEFGCCGTKCCPRRNMRCGWWRGQKVCCPRARTTVIGDEQVCCPAGTVAVPSPPGGCCPPASPECCGPHGSGSLACPPHQVCVRGTCVPI